MNQPTLLIASPYFPPDGGGLELYVGHLAEELSALGAYRVVIVTSGTQRGADTVTTVGNTTIYRLGYRFKISNTPFDPRWIGAIRRIIKTEKPVLINVHAPVPGLADVVTALSGQRPVIVTWHAASMRKPGANLANLAIGLYENVVMPWHLARAKRIITPSATISQGFLRNWQANTVVVSPGIDLDHFKPAGSPTAPTMLFVAGSFGSSYNHKGLTYLVEALPEIVRAVPAAHLTVIGEGDNQAEYEARAARLGVAGAITFAGKLHGDALVQAYQTARVLVHPALQEGFGMVISEAMACGRPVIASRVGGIPDLVEDGVTGHLVEPASSAQLAVAAITILQSAQLANALGQAGRAKLQTGYTWTSRAIATQNLFDQVRQTAMHPHIAQVVSYYPPHIGGMENVVQELAAVLAQKGRSIEVFTSNIGSTGAAPAINSPGVTVHRLPSLELLNTPIMFGLFTRLMFLPADSTIHVHISQALSPEISWLAAKLRGFNLVSHIHLDVEPSTAIGEIIFRPYKKIFLGFVLRHSQRVIVFSDQQREAMIQKYQLDPARVVVIPNGVAGSYFAPAHTQPHTPLRVLYVGRLAVQKRVDRIIEAMTLLPDVQLDIVGDGDQREQLELLTARHRLTSVRFHGIAQGSQLRNFYASADVLVMPSDREGMPLVALEAMAAGLPIIGSDVVGIHELLSGGVGCLVADPSPATFAATVQRLQANPAELETYAKASRFYAQNYSWETLADELLKTLPEARS